MVRRIAFTDSVFIAAFCVVAGIMLWKAWPKAPPDPATFLAEQGARIDQMETARKGIELIPPPSSSQEAKEMEGELNQILDLDRQAHWTEFQAWIEKAGKPETRAGFAQVWGDYQKATTALQQFLNDFAAAAASTEPGIEAKRTERYMALLNQFRAAEDALDGWVVQRSASDFQ